MIGRGNTDKMKYYMPCLGDDELSHKAPQSQTTRKDDWYNMATLSPLRVDRFSRRRSGLK